MSEDFAFFCCADNVSEVHLAGELPGTTWNFPNETRPLQGLVGGLWQTRLSLPTGHTYKFKFVLSTLEKPDWKHVNHFPFDEHFNNYISLPCQKVELRTQSNHSQISIAGSFSNWKRILMMKEGNNNFVHHIYLPVGIHDFRFVSGDYWFNDSNYPVNSMGNNYLEITSSAPQFPSPVPSPAPPPTPVPVPVPSFPSIRFEISLLRSSFLQRDLHTLLSTFLATHNELILENEGRGIPIVPAAAITERVDQYYPYDYDFTNTYVAVALQRGSEDTANTIEVPDRLSRGLHIIYQSNDNKLKWKDYNLFLENLVQLQKKK